MIEMGCFLELCMPLLLLQEKDTYDPLIEAKGPLDPLLFGKANIWLSHHRKDVIGCSGLEVPAEGGTEGTW